MNISYADGRKILETPGLSTSAKALLFTLILYMHPKSKKIYPSISTLAKDLSCDKRTIKNAIDQLKGKKLVVVDKIIIGGRKHNSYTVTFSTGYTYGETQEKEKADTKSPDAKPQKSAPSASDNEAPLTLDDQEEVCGRLIEKADCAIPSIFVDHAYTDFFICDFYDAFGKKVTRKTFAGHCIRMWKKLEQETKNWFLRRQAAYEKFWSECDKGTFTKPDGTQDEEAENAFLDDLFTKYHAQKDHPFAGGLVANAMIIDYGQRDIGYVPSHLLYQPEESTFAPSGAD